MLSKIQESFQPRHLGLIGLCLLAWAYLSLFRYDNYGIEEGAAMAMLINWSIVHQIASPVAFFGIPDLRAILFVPLDMHWAGSIIAVKVFTMYILFGCALLMYRWSEKTHGGESSMMATVLLLIAPISLMQTDAIGSGIYLLFSFVIAGWLNQAIHDSNQTIPSWFFLLILTTALAISMHPMGVAIPLALGMDWLRNREDMTRSKRMIGTLVLTTLMMLLLLCGWYGTDETSNPLIVLSDSILGSPLLHHSGPGFGILITALLFTITGISLFRRVSDPVSLILISASLIGFFQADHAWVFIVTATILYLGLPMLIELNERIGGRSLLGQRGILLLVVVFIATVSMLNMRQLNVVAKEHLKSPSDIIISVLEREAADSDAPFIAASQWPARTILVCRRDVLPLPPASNDYADFRKKTKGLTHIAFNPQKEALHTLTRDAASLSDIFKPIAIYPQGVVLKAEKAEK